MGRKLNICVALSVVVLISVGVALGLIFGLKNRETVPDLSKSVMYSNTKETELMDINGVRVFGVKDYNGNVQAMHAIQTLDTVYVLDNGLLIQVQSAEYTLVFNYNETVNEYYVMLMSENSSYEIPYLYNTPTVKFPEFEFDIPMDANISNPFTGVVIELEDSVSQQLISDASLQLNYQDEQYGNRSVVMINTGGGRYYALLPTNDTTMANYFDTKKLYKTISQQSDSLIELIQAYPMADICSKVPQTAKSFCDGIQEEISAKLLDALRTGSKYADHVPLRSDSSTSINSYFEIVINIPGEHVMSQSLNDVFIDPNVLTVVSRKATASKGRCNEQTVAGSDTPDDRLINIGRGNVDIKFHYETYTVEDQIDVYYTNEQKFSSGCVGTEGERVTTLRLDDNEANLRVKVTPNCAGGSDTKWYYAVECLNQDLECGNDRCYCGFNKRPSRQVNPPTFDGCGTRRSWTYAIIHAIGEQWKFTPVCNKHDLCYGTCNSDRTTCDNSFIIELNASCKDNWGPVDYRYIMCLQRAAWFHFAVWIAGTDAFQNAQNEDCSCDQTYIHDRILSKENKRSA